MRRDGTIKAGRRAGKECAVRSRQDAYRVVEHNTRPAISGCFSRGSAGAVTTDCSIADAWERADSTSLISTRWPRIFDHIIFTSLNWKRSIREQRPKVAGEEGVDAWIVGILTNFFAVSSGCFQYPEARYLVSDRDLAGLARFDGFAGFSSSRNISCPGSG